MFDSISKMIPLFLIAALCADSGLPNLSPRPDSQPRTFDVFAKAFYWYTSETNDWAYTRASTDNNVTAIYQTFVFDWAPGFSVGLGYNMDRDLWDTQASYTWFHSKATANAGDFGTITPGYLAARLSGTEPYITGRGSLTVHYNMFDWDIGRKYLVSEYLSLRPSIGIKGGWINQAIHTKWFKPGFTGTETLTQTFQAGGAKSGIAGKWCFGNLRKQAFSLLGLFDFAYLWGHWSIHDTFTSSSSTTLYTLQTTPRNYGSVSFHSFFGLAWDYNSTRTHLELKLGYEIEDWLNQCQFFTNIAGGENSDLVLQGITGGFDIEF
jgi:hypothetical protein